MESAEFKISEVSDGDKAKLVYLTHHLGLTDAIGFINNKIEETRAKVLLIAQVGAAKAAEYAKDNDNSYVNGHRAWLLNFVDRRISLPEKMCDPSKARAARDLLDITLAIR